MTDDDPVVLGSVEATMSPKAELDLARGWLAYGVRDTLYLSPLEELGRAAPRIIGRHPDVFCFRSEIAFDPVNDRVAIGDSGGNLFVWPLDGDGRRPERQIQGLGGDTFSTAFSPDGTLLAHAARQSGVRLWDLSGPVGAEPIQMGYFDSSVTHVAFSSNGRWLVSAGGGLDVALWPLQKKYCRVLRGHEVGVNDFVFSPDGSTLYTQGVDDGLVLEWNLEAGAGLEPRIVHQTTRGWGWGLQVDPEDSFLIVGGMAGPWKVPLDGGDHMLLEGFPRQWSKLDPSGRLLAGNHWLDHRTPDIDVLDLATGERRLLDPPGDGNVDDWQFDHLGRVLACRGGVLSRWDPKNETTEVLFDEGIRHVLALSDGKHLLLVSTAGTFSLFDLQDRSSVVLPSVHQGGTITFDSSTSIAVTGRRDGEIRVGAVSGGEPHLLMGHDGPVFNLAVSPDDRWIVSAGPDKTLRLWPMPDLSKPPLHALPRRELIEKLKSLTNLRAVPDAESHTGYRVEPDVEAYRGWATVPEW